nr:hypothetical protein [Oceanococcus sp. HetDA_MAG_MS8]
MEVGTVRSTSTDAAGFTIPASTVLPIGVAAGVSGPAGFSVGTAGVELVELEALLELSDLFSDPLTAADEAADTRNVSCGFTVDVIDNEAVFAHQLNEATPLINKIVSGINVRNSRYEWNSFCWNGGYYQPLSESHSSVYAEQQTETAFFWTPVDEDGEPSPFLNEPFLSGSTTYCNREYETGDFSIMGLGGAATLHAQIQEIPTVYDCPSTGKPMLLAWLGATVIAKVTATRGAPLVVNTMLHEFIKDRVCADGGIEWTPPTVMISGNCN